MVQFLCPVDGTSFSECRELEGHFLTVHFAEEAGPEEDTLSSHTGESDGEVCLESRADLSGVIASLSLPDNPLSELGDLTERKVLKWTEKPHIGAVDCLILSNQSFNSFKSTIRLDLTRLISLVKLDLSCNSIKSLEGVRECGNIRELNVSHNLVIEVSPLHKLIRLRRLDVSHNKIREITPLLGCINLKSLKISHNWVFQLENTLESLKQFRCLTELDIEGNICMIKTPESRDLLIRELWVKTLNGQGITAEDRDRVRCTNNTESAASGQPQQRYSDFVERRQSAETSDRERQLGILKQERNSLSFQLGSLLSVIDSIVQDRERRGIPTPPELGSLLNSKLVRER